MSSFVFDDSSVGVIFASVYLWSAASADNNPYIMFTRINQVDNVVDWSFYIGLGGQAGSVSFDTTSLPFLLQRKSKVFCAQVVKGTPTGNGGIFLVKFETSSGVNTIANPTIGDVIIQRVFYADAGTLFSTAQIIPDIPQSTSVSSGYNIYIAYLTAAGNYITIQEFDDSFSPTGFAIQFHKNVGTEYYVAPTSTSNIRKIYATTSDFYYLAVNFLKFSQSAGNIESVLLKQDYNLRHSGMHICHKWIETTIMTGSFTANSFTPVVVPASDRQKWVFDWKYYQTATNGLIRSQQMHPYQTKVLYPRRESQAVIPQPPSPATAVAHSYDEFLPTTSCQTIQASSPIELNSIIAILGNKDAYTEGTIETIISQSQCQKQDLAYTYMYPTSLTAQTLEVDDFIKAETGTVTVDVGDSFIGKDSQTPGYRAVYAKACNTLSVLAVEQRPCSTHSLQIMTFPSDFNPASKFPTARSPVCLPGTEWPKVLSQDPLDPTIDHNAYLGMQVDQANGNIVMCGWSLMPVHETKLYKNGAASTNKKAIIFLLNTVGDIMWHYTFKQIKTLTSDVSAQHCRFSMSGQSIFSLLHDTAENQLSLMKQGYEQGSVIFLRRIPGTFSNPLLGAGPLGTFDGQYFFEQDKTTNYDHIYISARATGFTPYHSWHLYKIDMTNEKLPKQLWHSYYAQTLTTQQNQQVIDQLGIQTNIIAAGTLIESTSNRRHILFQVDKTTGLYKDLLIYKVGTTDGLGKGSGTAAYTTYASQSFTIDKNTDGSFNALYYAFIESSTPTSQDLLHYMSTNENFGATYQFHVQVTGITQAASSWITIKADDLTTATGYVYIYVGNSANQNYLYAFQKQTGASYLFYHMSGAASSIHMFNKMDFFKGATGNGVTVGKSIYLSFTATGYASSKYSGVINKVGTDFSTTESCIKMQTATTVGPNTHSLLTYMASSRPYATIMSTQLYLNPTLNYYGELVFYHGQNNFGFRSAEALGCLPPPAVFSQSPQNAYLIAKDDGTATDYPYTIPSAAQCSGVLLMGDWEIDRINPATDPKYPDWVTQSSPVKEPLDPKVITGAGGSLTFTVAKTLIGSYSFRVKYWSPTNSAKVEAAFVVDVYPETEYSHPQVPSTTCVPDIYPATFGNYPSIQIYDGDTYGNKFMICGSTLSQKILQDSSLTAHNYAFVQLINSNMMIDYQQIFNLNDQDQYMSHCQFSSTGHVFYALNSMSSTLRWDKIYMYKYVMATAKFVDGKMISVTNSATGEILIQTMVVDLYSNDQWYGGSIRSKYLNFNQANREAFILKLDQYMAQKYFRTFQGSGDTASIVQMYPDTNSGLYAHMRSVVTSPNEINRVIRLTYQSPGTTMWNSYIYNPTSANLPKGRGGLVTDLTNVYSCQVNKAETYIMKIDISNGALTSANLREMGTTNADDCNLILHTNTNTLILAIRYVGGAQGLVEIFKITPGTMALSTATSKMKMTIGAYYPQRQNRFFLSGSGLLWLIVPTISATKDSIFFTKFNDVAGMTWPSEIKCSEIHAYDPTTTYSGYNYGALGGDGTSMLASYSVNAAGFTHWSPILNQDQYLHFMTADQIFSIKYARYIGDLENDPADDKDPWDLKFSFSATCSVWARPTTQTLSDRLGALAYSIGPKTAYDFKQLGYEVNHCQKLEFVYDSTLYKLDTNVNPNVPIYTAFPAMSNPKWVTNFDTSTLIYTFDPQENSLVGTYQIALFGTLVPVSEYQVLGIRSIGIWSVELRINTPPSFDKYSYNVANEMYAYHTWSVVAKYENDVEGDDAYQNAEIVKSISGTNNLDNPLDWTPISPQPTSYFIVNTAVVGDLSIQIKKPPQPSGYVAQQMYYIRLLMWDIFNINTQTMKIISMKIKLNTAPDALPGQVDYVIPDVKVTYGFTFPVLYKNFKDVENDEIVFDCSSRNKVLPLPVLDATEWVKVSDLKQIGGSITLSGTVPPDNKWTGSYQFKCIVKDIWLDLFTTHIFTLNVIQKPDLVVTGGPDPYTFRLPEEYTTSLLAFSSCPWNLPYTKTLLVNGTAWTDAKYGTWMVWDETVQLLTITPNANEQAGNHTLSVVLDDSITTPKIITWVLNLYPDYPLVQKIDLPNRFAIVDNRFYFHFNKFEIFSNPEPDQATNIVMYFRQKDSKPPSLPYFIKVYPNGTIYGLGTQSEIGTFILECVGIDDAGWETPIEFQLTVQPCYYKCSACWNTDYNTCLQCRKGFYLLNTECNDLCPQGTYASEKDNKCYQCSSECKVCTGPDHSTECPVCNTGFYRLNNGCWEKCPDGYWGDKQDYFCKPCNEACTKCDGPLSSQCDRCAELFQVNDIGKTAKAGYLLVGKECQVPKCADGQYFKWYQDKDPLGNYLGECANCHKTCKKCVGPNSNDCVSCVPGLQINTLNECVECKFINVGLQLNEELECEDICGDSIIVSKPCDDGNTFNGDGCSKNCFVEFGFVCDKPPGQPCRNIIPPTFSITTNSKTNQHFIEFTKSILVANENSISPSNMNVVIVGKKALYRFSWRIVDDPNNPLIPGREINRFSIKLFDIMSTLTGTENVRVSFIDYSQIKDVPGNMLVNNSFAERNPAPFIYVSEDEASAIAGGGESMKYAFLSALGFQLGLKVIINGSMQYLWGLVHALQVFQYLLLMNIKFPPNLPAFCGYFSIASGDSGQMGISEYIPDIKKFLIKVEDIEDQYDNELLPPKFVEAEISPYFIISYSDKISMWMCAIFILLPILLLLNKMCKKITLWENILGGFFFNGPLRTITEMYFEMIITILVNTEFIKFRNRSQMIASAFAFGFGAFSILLPFILMTVIYKHRKVIRKRKFIIKYGMLTDEFSQKNILQLNYYSALLFQRIVYSAALVYLYSFPMLQCFIAGMANLGMVLYLVIVRPYKEENQQTTQAIDELILFICVLFFVYIYFKQDEMTIEESKQLGWIIIFIMLSSILKNLFVVLYFGFVNMRKKMKSMFSAEDEMLDSPHTSDDKSDTIDSIPTEEIEEDIRKEVYEKDEFNERIKQRQEQRGTRQQAQQPQFNAYAGNPMMMAMGPPMYPGQMMMAPPPGYMMYQDPNAMMYNPQVLNYEDQGVENAYEEPIIQEKPKASKKHEKFEENQQTVKPQKKNNFLGDISPGVNAQQQLDELEQVANDYGDYGFEYGDYYGGEYGQEGYGQEAENQAVPEKKVEKAAWDAPNEEVAQDEVQTFNVEDIGQKTIPRRIPPPQVQPDVEYSANVEEQMNQNNNEADATNDATKENPPQKQVNQKEEDLEVIEADLDGFEDLE